ncbi:MAG: co-chaperone GroES family protein [Candidatus Omnitrophica bacterium]|nr:co-chaperone GroES family protein [Candidatus Omnitrophota bacterium]
MNGKELVLVGDRVLILPDQENDKTDTGLYLPQGIKEREKVQTGKVIKVGPGYPIASPEDVDSEPWKARHTEGKYLPLQAQEGDYCIFLRNAGIEIDYESKKYIVVPHSAILLLLRS